MTFSGTTKATTSSSIPHGTNIPLSRHGLRKAAPKRPLLGLIGMSVGAMIAMWTIVGPYVVVHQNRRDTTGKKETLVARRQQQREKHQLTRNRKGKNPHTPDTSKKRLPGETDRSTSKATPTHTSKATPTDTSKATSTDTSKATSNMVHDEPNQSQPEEPPDYYLVFSTSCDAQQHWESFVFFFHCRRVGQRGVVTRIASGCRENEGKELLEFHERYIVPMANASIQTFALHMTPDYSRVRLERGKHPYKYHNKPFGLQHWMEHALQLQWNLDNTDHRNAAKRIQNATLVSPLPPERHQRLLDGIVILLDPDMVLLQPIGHDFASLDNTQWVIESQTQGPIHTKVSHGHPVAQQDGYLGNEWMDLNWAYVTNDTDAIPRPPRAHGPIHWNTGPPYLATVKDMFRIATVWTDTAPRVLDVYPELFSEMFSFLISTVQLELPFALTKSIVVSTTDTDDREGWSYIDAIPDDEICSVAVAATKTNNTAPLPILPTGLHYCGIYILDKTMFSKYRIKKNIMRCDKNLMKPPSRDLFPRSDESYFYITPLRADLKDADTYEEVHKGMSKRKAKREAFMLCGMTSALNEALRYYKQAACATGMDTTTGPLNLSETYTIHTDPTNY